MSLRLALRPGAPGAAVRVDAARLGPDHLAGLAPDAAARLTLPTTTGDAALGELFAVRGDDGPPDAVVIEGDLRRFTRLGAGMTRGAMTVHGDAGERIGSGMAGGRLAVEGDAGARAGEGMRGGILLICGGAGEEAGAPLPGATEGQSGGALVVRGPAGAGAGHRMRRGLLALGGATAAAGTAMIAGSIFLFAAPGDGTGAMMRRGTIVVLAPYLPGPCFSRSDRGLAPWLAPYWDALGAAGLPVPAAIGTTRWRRYRGDSADGARGEILMREET